MTDFDTLKLTRDIACAPERLFGLVTDATARAAWGAPDDESVIEIDHGDIREGGYELARCGPKEAPHFTTRMDFHVISPDERVIGTETLSVGGERLSVALVSMEITEEGNGSRLIVTLQIASLAGPELFDDYLGGWTGALGNLEKLAVSGKDA